MKKLANMAQVFALVSITAALSACGGGGAAGSGDPASAAPSPAPAPAPAPKPPAPTCPTGQTETTVPTWNGSAWVGQVCTPTPAVASTGTLKTSVAAATYVDGSLGQSAFNALNLVRQNAGAGLVSQSAALDTSAAAHARYLTTNIATAWAFGAHNEDSTKPDYYEFTPVSRMAKAGLAAGFWTEVIGGTGQSRVGSECILGLMNTVYHGAALLSQATYVGLGFGTDTAGIPMCVGDLATLATESYTQVMPTGKLIAYPYDGQTDLFATFYIANEIPRPPVSLFPNTTSGTPVIVSVRNSDFVNYKAASTLSPVVTKFEMKDAGGNIVPAGVLASPYIAGSGVALTTDPTLGEGFVVLVPFSPLVKGATYSVTFAVTLKAGGTPVTKSWGFTTGYRE